MLLTYFYCGSGPGLFFCLFFVHSSFEHNSVVFHLMSCCFAQIDNTRLCFVVNTFFKHGEFSNINVCCPFRVASDSALVFTGMAYSHTFSVTVPSLVLLVTPVLFLQVKMSAMRKGL